MIMIKIQILFLSNQKQSVCFNEELKQMIYHITKLQVYFNMKITVNVVDVFDYHFSIKGICVKTRNI